MRQAIRLQLPQHLAKALSSTNTSLGKIAKDFVFLNFVSIETAAEAMSHVNEELAGKVLLGGKIYNVKADWDNRMRGKYSSAIDQAMAVLRQATSAAAAPSNTSLNAQVSRCECKNMFLFECVRVGFDFISRNFSLPFSLSRVRSTCF